MLAENLEAPSAGYRMGYNDASHYVSLFAGFRLLTLLYPNVKLLLNCTVFYAQSETCLINANEHVVLYMHYHLGQCLYQACQLSTLLSLSDSLPVRLCRR